MKKLKLNLLETSIVTNDTVSDTIDITVPNTKPDYTITDVTILSDRGYHPTIQNILIDLDESHKLNESESVSKDLTINILSEAVNPKTNYSYSLFEFESKESVVTLSLTLTEGVKAPGLFQVNVFTTKGEKIFESNTVKPKEVIQGLLNRLSNQYLISEAALLIKPEGKSISEEPEIKEESFVSMEYAIDSVLERNNEEGAELRDHDVYINKSAKDKFTVSDKQTKNTVALVTPEDNVFILRLTDIPEYDVEDLKPDKGIAKAPEELKTIEVKAEEIKEADTVSPSIISIGDYKINIDHTGNATISKNGEVITTIQVPKGTDPKEYISFFKKYLNEADEAEGETVEEIENNEIDEPQEEDNSLIMPSAKFIYNAKDLRDLEDKISRNLTTRATYSIVDELELPVAEFEAFTSDFGKDYDFLNDFRPRRTDATYDCILVSGEGSDVKLLIDPSGTPRAKFVSIL